MEDNKINFDQSRLIDLGWWMMFFKTLTNILSPISHRSFVPAHHMLTITNTIFLENYKGSNKAVSAKHSRHIQQTKYYIYDPQHFVYCIVLKGLKLH